MLSGRAPFQSRSKDDTSASIIARIKDGSFDMSGPEWVSVSSQAKKLIKGKFHGNILLALRILVHDYPVKPIPAVDML